MYRHPSSNTIELSWSSVQGIGSSLPTQTAFDARPEMWRVILE